ncbi:MAG: hypothetical protein AB7N80_15490 [Bdellovibrionales bacterium]
MTDARVVAAISRFFFLALLDEHAAFLASTKAVADWRMRILKSTAASKEGPILLVAALQEAWSKLEHIPQTGQPVVFSEQDWLVPADLDLGPWLEFRRAGSRDEFFVLVTVKVLNLPVEVVAAGLKETVGTVRHRLARGLLLLGQIQMGNHEALA